MLALIFAAALASCAPPRHQPSPRHEEVVHTGPELVEALKRAHGGETIHLAPGDYDAVTVRGGGPQHGMDFSTPVTIDGGGQAVLRGLSLIEVGGIHVTRLHFKGDIAVVANGVFVRQSRDIAVTNSEFEQVWAGIGHLNIDGLLIDGNNFHNIGSDGIRGGGSSHVTITNNTFTEFHPTPTDHPDAIQFWTSNTTTPATDILVAHNRFERGAGQSAQGVFLRDETGHLPYNHVKIVDNVIIGGAWNGLMIDGGLDDIEVTGNLCQAYQDQGCRVRVQKVLHAKVERNKASQVLLIDSPDVHEKHNDTLRAIDAPKLDKK